MSFLVDLVTFQDGDFHVIEILRILEWQGDVCIRSFSREKSCQLGRLSSMLGHTLHSGHHMDYNGIRLQQ